jgi:hypothetical protein
MDRAKVNWEMNCLSAVSSEIAAATNRSCCRCRLSRPGRHRILSRAIPITVTIRARSAKRRSPVNRPAERAPTGLIVIKAATRPGGMKIDIEVCF